jgi:hypothetical protein
MRNKLSETRQDQREDKPELGFTLCANSANVIRSRGNKYMISNKDANKECGIIAFHATTKENMKKIMKEGLKPGGSGGWIDIAQKASPSDKEHYEMYRSKKERTFLAGNLGDGIESYYPSIPNLDTVAILCIPQEDIYKQFGRIYEELDEQFKQWDKRRFKEIHRSSPFISRYPEIRLREKISPENIIGCMDIIRDDNNEIKNAYGLTKVKHPEYDIGGWGLSDRVRYKVNRECKFD